MAVAPNAISHFPPLVGAEIERLIETPTPAMPGRRDRASTRLCFMRPACFERAGLDRSRGSESERAHGPRDGQGRQATARAVQPEHAVALKSWMHDRAGFSFETPSTPTRPDVEGRAAAASSRHRPKREADSGTRFRQLPRHALTGRSVDVMRRYVAQCSTRMASAPTRCVIPSRRHLLQRGAICAPSRSCSAHSRLSTTQRYTHVTRAQLIDVYRKSHPRASVSAEKPLRVTKGGKIFAGARPRFLTLLFVLCVSPAFAQQSDPPPAAERSRHLFGFTFNQSERYKFGGELLAGGRTTARRRRLGSRKQGARLGDPQPRRPRL